MFETTKNAFVNARTHAPNPHTCSVKANDELTAAIAGLYKRSHETAASTEDAVHNSLRKRLAPPSASGCVKVTRDPPNIETNGPPARVRATEQSKYLAAPAARRAARGGVSTNPPLNSMVLRGGENIHFKIRKNLNYQFAFVKTITQLKLNTIINYCVRVHYVFVFSKIFSI